MDYLTSATQKLKLRHKPICLTTKEAQALESEGRLQWIAQQQYSHLTHDYVQVREERDNAIEDARQANETANVMRKELERERQRVRQAFSDRDKARAELKQALADRDGAVIRYDDMKYAFDKRSQDVYSLERQAVAERQDALTRRNQEIDSLVERLANIAAADIQDNNKDELIRNRESVWADVRRWWAHENKCTQGDCFICDGEENQK